MEDAAVPHERATGKFRTAEVPLIAGGPSPGGVPLVVVEVIVDPAKRAGQRIDPHDDADFGRADDGRGGIGGRAGHPQTARRPRRSAVPSGRSVDARRGGRRTHRARCTPTGCRIPRGRTVDRRPPAADRGKSARPTTRSDRQLAASRPVRATTTPDGAAGRPGDSSAAVEARQRRRPTAGETVSDGTSSMRNSSRPSDRSSPRRTVTGKLRLEVERRGTSAAGLVANVLCRDRSQRPGAPIRPQRSSVAEVHRSDARIVPHDKQVGKHGRLVRGGDGKAAVQTLGQPVVDRCGNRGLKGSMQERADEYRVRGGSGRASDGLVRRKVRQRCGAGTRFDVS